MSSHSRRFRHAILSASVATLLLGACTHPTDPAPGPSSPAPATPSTDSVSLRLSVDPSFAGRVLLLRWYHVSYEDPDGAYLTLANRPFAQAMPISAQASSLALPSTVDTLFGFYAKASEYARTEQAGMLDPDDLIVYDSLSKHRYAVAPLTLASSDEMAKVTFSRIGSWTPQDTVTLQGSHVLLWVKEPLQAAEDPFLKGWGLVGKIDAGWHLLRYEGSKKMVPCPLTDTVFFRKSNPLPNLV